MIFTSGTIRVLICPNAFKGSLTAKEVCDAIALGLQRASYVETNAVSERGGVAFSSVSLPLADGGDGTLQTLVGATGGSIECTQVHGPLGDAIQARWGRLGGDQGETAVIEMAEASGLRLLTRDRYDPWRASTFGTGELMLAAIGAGCRRLLVGIGGSATNDCGAGMAMALGARFLRADGTEAPAGALGVEQTVAIDLSSWRLPSDVEIVVACDVENPLTGTTGASAVYGPQKGATPDDVARLDAALHRFAALLEATTGVCVEHVPGAGAAGGLGAGLMAFCGAKLMGGARMALDAVAFERHLSECDLVITGEGLLDSQTAHGKLIAAVAHSARVAGKPCIGIAGGIEEGAEPALYEMGLTAAFSIAPGPISLEEAMARSVGLLVSTAERVGRTLIALRS